MLVGGCNLAQLTAWASYFDCAAFYKLCTIVQKDKNLLCSYANFFDTYNNLYLTSQLNILKIFYWTFCLSADIIDFWIFMCGSVV